MNGEQHQEILRTEGLSKFFPGVKALDNVNLACAGAKSWLC
jgi:simple sugar transport system ATP-binding protein